MPSLEGCGPCGSKVARPDLPRGARRMRCHPLPLVQGCLDALRFHLIRPSLRTGAPSPRGEGFVSHTFAPERTVMIKNCPSPFRTRAVWNGASFCKPLASPLEAQRSGFEREKEDGRSGYEIHPGSKRIREEWNGVSFCIPRFFASKPSEAGLKR